MKIVKQLIIIIIPVILVVIVGGLCYLFIPRSLTNIVPTDNIICIYYEYDSTDTAEQIFLTEQEQQELLTQLEEHLVLGSQVAQVTKEVKEMRFSKGRVCCHCNGTDVVRNGKNKGVQRYLCRSCKKSFSDLTNSATYKSKKTLDKWLRYAKCMLNGYSIRKSAEIVEINIATSFYWRHKILNCISEFLGIGSVDGLVEADEVFFAYSYKGTKPTNMPRPSRHRGKEVKKRGISKEQVYVATALDRQGNLIIELFPFLLKNKTPMIK